MIKIDVLHLAKASNFPVDSAKLVSKLKGFLESRKIDNVEVVISVTDEDEMLRLGKIYLKEKGDNVHNVLSFVSAEVKGKFIYPPKGLKKLGEIAVCYPKAVREARQEGKEVDEKIYELAQHGVKHLLGEHHK